MTNEGMLSLLTSDIMKINHCLKNITDNYTIIGQLLSETKRRETIEKTNYKGYKNIAEFALAEFGFEKSKTYNLITVYEKFFRNKQDNPYKNYQFSNLVLMLSMTDEQINKCDSTMTNKQIKEIKCNFSMRMESETVASTQNVLKNNVIEGVFPDKKDSEEPEQKQNTIIVTELPKPEKMENKTITIEVKSEQNNDFVTLSDIEKIRLLSEEITDLKVSIMFKDSEIRKLQDNMQIQCTMSKKQSEKDSDMINFIYDELYNINNPIQNDKIEMLLNQIHNYTKNNALPQKINFMQNVI